MVATRATRRLAVIVAGLALAAIATVARADDRTLSWRSLEVTARLDADGRLHVRERHAMVFDGDWNGGERAFRLRGDQDLTLEHVWREDAAAGGALRLRELQEGDLARVDHFAWTDSHTLRWRSRLPSDPPFAHQEIVYDLDYVLSGILVPQGHDGKSFLLDHDFAFPDREWPIERYSVDLQLDPAWEPVKRARHLEGGPLSPGQSVTLSLPMRYLGKGRPAGVTLGPSRGARLALIALLVALLPVPIVIMLRREQALGRFGPLPAPDEIDAAWLHENVFSLGPELAGAAWDERTGTAEVTAILARLEGERKIKSEVTRGRWPFSPPELHLHRLVPLDAFAAGYERDLVRALFVAGEHTSTSEVRKHYRGEGFDPAHEIRELMRMAAAVGGGEPPPRPTGWPALAMALAGLFLLALSVVRHHRLDSLALGIGIVPVAFLYGWSVGFARRWAGRVDRLVVAALPWAIGLLALAAGTIVAMWLEVPTLQLTTLVGCLLVCLALWTSVAHQASTRMSAGHIALRRRLLAARRHFARELRSPQPRLEDGWVPWLIAFGLGKVLDRWSVRHVPSALGDGGVGSWSGSAGGSSSSSGGGGFSGGGGSFGGAGAAAAWSAAAAGMAAGVAAPSSSSSGGGSSGGGGGSSSGGGGGGGW